MRQNKRVSRKYVQLDSLSKVAVNIPLINVISGFSVQMLGRDTLHMGNIRALLFFSIIFFVLKVYGVGDRITKRLLLFMFYLFLLILLSSNFMYSFTDSYLKILVSMLMFPVGFYLLNDRDKLIMFLKNFIYAGLLLCINFILAQIFNIGRSVYLADSFYYGYAGIGSTVVLSYLILTTPLLKQAFSSITGKMLLRIVVFLSILFTIVALKRIAIIALFIGYIVYLIKSKKIIGGLKYVAIILFFLIITKPLYFDVFKERLEVRTTENNELEQEQRYYDFIFAIQDLRNKGIKHALIGTEAFNTPGYFGRERQVHVDYANILIGTGLIGLLFYLWIYLTIYLRFSRFYRLIKKFKLFTTDISPDTLQDINGVFSAVLVASLIVSFSGGMHVITTRSILFILLGSLLGIVYKHYNQYKVSIPATVRERI